MSIIREKDNIILSNYDIEHGILKNINLDDVEILRSNIRWIFHLKTVI